MRLPPFRRLLLTAVSASALVVVLAQSAFADPRDFQLQNNSSVDIAAVYISPSDLASWGDDVMGSDVLVAGNAVNLTFRGFDGATCNYDIKVLGVGGQDGYLYKVDLCSISTVTFS
jgi:hypothetical protein